MDAVLANRSEEEEIYPLTTVEIAEAKRADATYKYPHPGRTHLEETINAAMYWKGMRTTIRSLTKSCKTCQINKRQNYKYGHLPAKIVTSTPWECLCVNLIGPYTLEGKDSSQIDFLALPMIDPASSWFEFVVLPLVKQLPTMKVNSLTTMVAYVRPFIFELLKEINFSANFCPPSQPRLTPTS